MRRHLALFLSVMALPAVCRAAEITVDESKTDNLEISVYNNNLALVKDTRRVDLKQGENDVAFENVATQIKAESAIIVGKDIQVLEQNYDFDLLTTENIIKGLIGREVKTVVENPTTGENIFDKAKIISVNYGSPVLQFSYGIETRFPGRIVFENLPENLRGKPTLTAKITSVEAGLKELSLAYLTNGISWKTNYVAKVSTQNKLDLTGWVTITNQSGINYRQAKVQLIAGDVNQVADGGIIRPVVNRMMLAKAPASDMAVAESAAGVPQQISGYHLYTLPLKTDIKDNQTKQISLIEKNGVKYAKEGRLTSSLYLGGKFETSFEKRHPDMYYIMLNDESDNLGLPLPAGIVRFYENDKNGSLQFIGENSIGHVAKGEKIELNLGKFFDVFVDGKVSKVTKVSEDNLKTLSNGCRTVKIIRSYDAEVVFNNGGNEAQKVIFTQNIATDAKITAENVPGQLKDANTYRWQIEVPAGGKFLLNYTAEVPSQEQLCD